MSTPTNSTLTPKALETEAINIRLNHFSKVKMRLIEWLDEDYSRLKEYEIIRDRIEVESEKYEAQLSFLAKGYETVSPPSQDDVNYLRDAVKALSQKIALSKTTEDFMKLITDSAQALG